jgi:hypothetical protein
VTPDSKIDLEEVKMCQFSSGNWFFSTKFTQLAEKCATQLCTSKKECNTVFLIVESE